MYNLRLRMRCPISAPTHKLLVCVSHQRAASPYTSPWRRGAFEHAEETRFACAPERRKARVDGHAVTLARVCRDVLHAVLLLGQPADKPRGATSPHQRSALAVRLMVRPCVTRLGQSTHPRHADVQSL